jgi:hypothetical protein
LRSLGKQFVLDRDRSELSANIEDYTYWVHNRALTVAGGHPP